MIKKMNALSMAEASEYLDKSASETKAFIKSFNSLKPAEAKELREKLMGLNLIRLNEKHISKLIDILPADKEELNKILSDISFDENDTNNILQTIKNYK